jgi:hypothetical protein
MPDVLKINIGAECELKIDCCKAATKMAIKRAPKRSPGVTPLFLFWIISPVQR